MVEEVYGKEFVFVFDVEILQFMMYVYNVYYQIQEIIIVELNLIEKMFCFFIGLDKIEFFQSYDNEEIYRKVFEIIEYYFSGEDEDDKIMLGIDQNFD